MATFLGAHRSLVRAFRRQGLRGFLEARSRQRLARAVHGHARDEREHRHRAGVIEFASIAARTALYERIAERLQDLDLPVAARGVGRLERLLAEPAPFRDYGPRARERNARIKSVLADLEVERADAVADENHSAAELAVDRRAGGAFEIDRSGRAEK